MLKGLDHELESKYLEKKCIIFLIQFCGSVMFFQDPIFSILDPGSRVVKIPDPDPHRRISIFNPKNWYQVLKNRSWLWIFSHPGSWIWITDPGSGSRGNNNLLVFFPMQRYKNLAHFSQAKFCFLLGGPFSQAYFHLSLNLKSKMSLQHSNIYIACLQKSVETWSVGDNTTYGL